MNIILSFYIDDEQKIKACIDEMRAISPVVITNVTYQDVPENNQKHTELLGVKKQAILGFGSIEDRNTFRQDKKCFAIYNRDSR